MDENINSSYLKSSGKKYRYLLPLFIGLLGVIVVVMLLVGNKMRNQQHQDHLFMDAIEDVQITTSLFHLWLEEYIAGDRTKDIKTVFSYLENAEKEIHVMLYGGVTSHGTLSDPITDPVVIEAVNELHADLNTLKESGSKRLDHLEKSGTGTDLDQSFDRDFDGFLNNAGKLEELWIDNEKKYMARSGNVIMAVIIAWTSTLCLSIIGVTLLERKRSRAESETLQSEEKFRRVISTANDAIITIDHTGAIRQWNNAATGIFGYTEDEMIGSPVSSIIPERYKTAHTASLKHYLKNGKRQLTYPVVLEGLNKNGTEVPIELTTAAWTVNGEQGFTSFIRDITERKNAEDSLKESERRYRELYENSPLGYQSLDSDGCLIESNSTLCWMLGYSREEMIGKWFGDFLTEGSREKFKKNFSRFKSSGEVRGVSFDVVRSDGSSFMVEIDGRVGHDDKGDFKQTHCIITDVTSRKKTEKKLKESEERFRSIFNTAKDGFYVIDLEGRYRNVNDAVCKLFGYTREQFLSSDIRLLLFPEDMDDIFNKHSNLWADGGFVSDLRLRDKEGAELYVDINITPLQIGGESFALGVVRDMTERRKTDQELKKMDKLQSVGILAGGIAHDFNNIMAAIVVNIGLAQTYLNPADEAYKILAAAEKSALKGSSLSNQLITFSSGGTPVKTVLVLPELITESAHFSLSGSDIILKTDIADDLWPIIVDEGQFTQVIHNLIINSSQAMPNGGEVSISAHNVELASGEVIPLKAGRYVKIEVADCGEGIAEDIRARIFDPYFTTKGMGQEKGTGLGLAIVHSIIKAHNGCIDLDSKIGKGTTFYFYLPVHEEYQVDPHVDTKELSEVDAPKDKIRILILEDDEQVYAYLPKLLWKLGYEAVIATDGTEAITRYQEALEAEQPFSAVIIDLVIRGGMGGKEAMKELLKIDPEVRALVSSGYSMDPSVLEYEKYGFKGTLTKPYTVENLKSTLFKLLENRR